MSNYTEFHPRWYRRRVSTYWWLKQRSHLAFILRELSAIFVFRRIPSGASLVETP